MPILPTALFPAAVVALAVALGIWRVMRGAKRLPWTAPIRFAKWQDTFFARQVVNATNDGLIIQTLDGRILWANPAYCRLHQRRKEDMLGLNPLSFAILPGHGPSAAEIATFRYDPADPFLARPHKRQNWRADGTAFWIEISVSFTVGRDGQTYAISVCRDITEEVAREEKLTETTRQLEYVASHDSLTGVLNRAAFSTLTSEHLANRAADRGHVGLIHLDLDHFKIINDTHGHSAGDAVLLHVARALRNAIGPQDIVARIGGDEFVVVLPQVATLGDLERTAGRLRTAVAQPLDWRDRKMTCSTSIGAALSDAGICTPEDLLQRADFALYDVKRTGRGKVATYDKGLHKRYAKQMQMAADLRQAIELGDLSFVFQPIFDLRTGTIGSLETLVRWDHPTEGRQSPADFLPMAGDLGLMADLDYIAMNAALDMKQSLNRAGQTNIHVNFNASEAMLAHPEFVRRLTSGVLGRGIDPAQVAIEVLETIVFADVTENTGTARIISDLRDAGYNILLDDFGVGHAGLAHLAQLDVTGVKIDRSLIRNMPDDATSSKIVATMVDLCADLGLQVVAEGVETPAVANHLWDLGCSSLQGFWFSRPLDAGTVVNWVRRRNQTPTPRHATGPLGAIGPAALPKPSLPASATRARSSRHGRIAS